MKQRNSGPLHVKMLEIPLSTSQRLRKGEIPLKDLLSSLIAKAHVPQGHLNYKEFLRRKHLHVSK